MCELLYISLISHANKIMVLVNQSRVQCYMEREMSVVEAGFKKDQEIRVIIVGN